MVDTETPGELPLEHLGGERYRVHMPRLHYRSAFAPKRPAEVAMLIQRTPDWVLLQTKEHYPPGAFRLPTGTLEVGESSEAGMLRELGEEANLKPGRHRVLFRLEYIVSGGRDDFFTEAYLIEEPTGELKVNDPGEKISAWREARRSSTHSTTASFLPAQGRPVLRLSTTCRVLMSCLSPWGAVA